MGMELKTCTKCKKELPANKGYFCASKSQPSGLYPSCKQCRRDYRNKNKDEINRKKMEYYYANREDINKKRRQKRKYNPEKYREQSRLNRLKNIEKARRQEKEAHRRNKEYRNKQSKEYYDKNKEIINKQQREYYAKNKEKLWKTRKKWRIENRERIYTLNHSRRIKEKNLKNDLTEEEWKDAKDFFKNSCAYCGEITDLTRDHFIPVHQGGGHTSSNIIPSCLTCNCSKKEKDFFKWYPSYKNYSKKREDKILKYLRYSKTKEQQLTLL